MEETKVNPINQETVIRYQMEIRLAMGTFPGIPIEEAYRKWKEIRGEKPELTFSGAPHGARGKPFTPARKIKERPCTREGCKGIQLLEGVCSGCVEGLAGYKTKWTCKTCLHRDLSKEDFISWLQKLSSP